MSLGFPIALMYSNSTCDDIFFSVWEQINKIQHASAGIRNWVNVQPNFMSCSTIVHVADGHLRSIHTGLFLNLLDAMSLFPATEKEKKRKCRQWGTSNPLVSINPYISGLITAAGQRERSGPICPHPAVVAQRNPSIMLTHLAWARDIARTWNVILA